MPRGAPTVALQFRMDAELVAWVDADIARRGKGDSRREWFTDLVKALRDGRITVAQPPPAPPPAPARRPPPRPYPKPNAK